MYAVPRADALGYILSPLTGLVDATFPSLMDSFNYDQSDISTRYDAARKLPDETVKFWLERLAAHVGRGAVETIVDLGCGTGRFSSALARFFGAEVYAVDPSMKMLEVARAQADDARVHFLEGRAEHIPLGDAVADLIFMSMVYHHIADKAAAFGEFRRVIKPVGHLAVRTATREQLDSYLWLRFFPTAREIESQRTPAADALIETALAGGFRLDACEELSQLFAASLDEYCDKIALRGLSSLQAIDDAEFERGLCALREFCDSRESVEPVYEATALFFFGKD